MTDAAWHDIDVLQVDEGVAPAGHTDRNAVAQQAAFAAHARSQPQRFHWMPVEAADLDGAALAVVVTAERMGRRRMTLTLLVINRARRIAWIVTGAETQAVLASLLHADPALVASRVRRMAATIFAAAAACLREFLVVSSPPNKSCERSAVGFTGRQVNVRVADACSERRTRDAARRVFRESLRMRSPCRTLCRSQAAAIEAIPHRAYRIRRDA